MRDLIREYFFLTKAASQLVVHLQTIWIIALYWKNIESCHVLYKSFKKGIENVHYFDDSLVFDIYMKILNLKPFLISYLFTLFYW